MIRRNHFAIVVQWTIIATLMLPNNAMAYIGPGGGMEFIGYAMALLAMLGAAFTSVILWPFYKFMGWLRGFKAAAPAEPTAATTSVADACPAPAPLASLDNGPTIPSTPSIP